MLLHLLKYFEDLFDGTLGKWNTDPLDIELNTDAKTSSSRYYLFSHINKKKFQKKLTRFIKIGVLTAVQQL